MNYSQLIIQELKYLFRNPVVALTIFGGVVFYSFLYPLPYSHQAVEELPISIVNLDGSQASYTLERMVDATSQIAVAQRDKTLKDAQHALLNRDVEGILVIPEHFYKDLLLSKSPTLSYAGDASYFLVYGTIVEGLAQTGGTLAAKVKVAQLITNGVPLSLASQQYTPVHLNTKPTFNPRMGYIDYVVPAVFILILQQTLAMAAGLIGGSQKSSNGYWQQYKPWHIFTARSLVLVAIYFLMSMYYFGASFSFYGINKLASINHLLSLLLPFLLATTFIGIWLGSLMPRRELVTFVVLISSMPLIFSAGFIWPQEAMPTALIWLVNCFPSTPAIQAFLAVNQMGSDWQSVSSQYSLLWLQTLIWGAIAYLALKKANKQHKCIKTC